MNTTSTKILHLPNFYFPHIGGVEQVARDVVASLEGFEQEVFCFSEGRSDYDAITDGIRIRKIGYTLKLFSQAISFSYPFKLREKINSFNPDIIHIHLPNPLATLALLNAARGSEKIIIHWHSDIVRQEVLMPLFGPFQNRLLAMADRIIATSPNYASASAALQPFLHRTTIIPNIVNQDRLPDQTVVQSDIEEIKSKYNGKKIIFFCGRHVPYKGLEFLLKSLIAMHARTDFVAVIAGTGPLTQNLKRMANGDKNIVFCGRLSDQMLSAYLHASYLFAFPSITRNEAFGIALAEALYCGLPAVAFEIPGSGVEWVNQHQQTGLNAKNRDVNDYRRCLEVLLDDPALRETLSARAKAWVAENFLFSQFKPRIMGLYHELARP